MNRIVLPGATIGVLGSGQLGRMLALDARRMGYRVHTLSPGVDTPTGQVADLEVSADYDDLDAIRAFARGVDVMTFEFENVSTDAADAAAEIVPVRPSGSALHITQQRAREKAFLADRGYPVTPFAKAQTVDELAVGLGSIGLPAIVKTAAFGYDGKGQHRIDRIEDGERIWGLIGHQEAIIERLVDFTHEISVIAVRGLDGQFAHYGAVENLHNNHILDLTVAPARVSGAIASEAVHLAHRVLDDLGYVGVLCVEFFVTRRRAGARERDRAAAAQLRALHDRRVRDVAVRAAGARDLRPVARRHGADQAGGDGQPAGRSVDRRRARLGGGAGRARCEAAPVRQGRAACRQEDGPHHRARRLGGRGRREGARRPRRALLMIRFASFQIDPRTWLLTGDGREVDLSPRLVEILAFIVSRGGEIVTKEELLEKFWPDVNVTENTLTRAIADIRKAIGEDAASPRFLQTVSRRGYKFGGEAASITPATDPFQDWVKGRLALDSLDARKLNEAVLAFERATAELPKYAPAHAGLANAYLLQYERTRFGSAPDRELLARAMRAAQQASTLDPTLGEAWAVLGYLLSAAGQDRRGPGGGAPRHGARAGELAASLPARLRQLGRGAAARGRSHARR